MFLTPRQMGKSSLRVRTEQRLREEGITPVSVDLTTIGTAPVDVWYRNPDCGIATPIASKNSGQRLVGQSY